ncbi:MAG: recombination protein RecR [Proteobacteria bacterium]|nr:recombination protein RecR [Pseudomonadota bacterium]
MSADPLNRLVQELAKLPGIGERTAARLAFHILRAPASYAQQLAAAITELKARLSECEVCCMLTEGQRCRVCREPRRDATLVMVVATPQDVLAIERTASYSGTYHVLHGLLSPLDGVGPDALRIRALLARCGGGAEASPRPREVILATSPSVEGDATALYLGRLLRPLGVRTTRIASGVPIGGEIEFADGVTLHRAIEDRRELT